MGERVTVEVDSEALAAARAAGIDLSQLLSEALRRRLPNLNAAAREEEALKWYEENKEAVDAYNRLIEEHGLFSDGIRDVLIAAAIRGH
jgi:antitoxin CcdA